MSVLWQKYLELCSWLKNEAGQTMVEYVMLIVLVALGLGRMRLSPASARQWGLLLLGLSQAPPLGAILVVGWLLALAWRGAKGQSLSNGAFNIVQIGLVLLSLQALSALAAAVAEGLLGQPAMQIAGNGSQAAQLLWYQDRAGETLPQPWVISASARWRRRCSPVSGRARLARSSELIRDSASDAR